jgi:hypothetical protein
MKAKHGVYLLAAGLCLGFLATHSGMMNYRMAETMLVTALVLKIAGVLLLAYKLVRYEGLKKFMNK